MNKDAEKRQSTIIERIIDIACLIASNGILFLLPQKIDFWFYLLFGISAFLFCVGFFRLGFTFDRPAGQKGTILTGIMFVVLGAIVNTLGVCGIYRDGGSGRSITIATLLLIEALLFFAIAGSSAAAPGTQWKISVLFRIAAVIVVILGIGLAVRSGFSEKSIITGTMLIIEAIVLWIMGAGNNPFNTLTSEIQTVPGMKAPVEQICRDFSGVETQLGYPWIGKIKTIKGDAVIYGPLKDGFCVYGCYQFGKFYVSGSENPMFPDPEDANAHISAEIPDSNGVLLSKVDLPEAYAYMFAEYAETGKTQWSTEFSHKSKKEE